MPPHDPSECKIIKALNPVARIMETDWADVPLEAVLDTGLFDLDRAQENPLWLKELNGSTDHVPETEEYGIPPLPIAPGVPSTQRFTPKAWTRLQEPFPVDRRHNGRARRLQGSSL